MNNNTTNIVFGAIAVAILAGLLGYNTGKTTGASMMHQNMMPTTKQSEKSDATKMDHSQMSMDQMTKGLEGLTGDAFDKAFIEMMIAHHQGAVDMAKLIPTGAKHEELKKLGADIITAQTKEIEMMKSWLKAWGYEEQGQMMNDSQMMKGMDHSKMRM
jgi:uncharacterized protein (DUF305 family)